MDLRLGRTLGTAHGGGGATRSGRARGADVFVRLARRAAGVERRVSRQDDRCVIRDHVVLHSGDLDSLRRFKDDVKEVKQGYECGMMLTNFNDVREGDILEAFEIIEVARTL